MIKRARPKRVTLPDGRTFLARYKRATRDDLPPNINLARVYKERAAPKGKRRKRRRLAPYRERQIAALRRRNQRGEESVLYLKMLLSWGKEHLIAD